MDLSTGESIAAIVVAVLAVGAVVGKWAAVLVVNAVRPQLDAVHARIDEHMAREEQEMVATQKDVQAIAVDVAAIKGHLGL